VDHWKLLENFSHFSAMRHEKVFGGMELIPLACFCEATKAVFEIIQAAFSHLSNDQAFRLTPYCFAVQPPFSAVFSPPAGFP